MHFLPIVKITLPVLVCTDVLMMDVSIFNTWYQKTFFFNIQEIKVGLAIFLMKFGGLNPLGCYGHEVS